MSAEQVNHDRWRRYWDKTSASYDRQMRFCDRVLLADSRSWVCAQATGNTLEVAIGTGLNLPFYPGEVQLTGIDFSPAMLGVAQTRARQLGRTVDLQEADAQALPFPDASFDTAVCTFALCAIPDERRAVSEMIRVLRPGGLLLLARSRLQGFRSSAANASRPGWWSGSPRASPPPDNSISPGLFACAWDSPAGEDVGCGVPRVLERYRS
jgi:ubiquinone/menaquinone biosynthesis C-methylase UbiE